MIKECTLSFNEGIKIGFNGLLQELRMVNSYVADLRRQEIRGDELSALMRFSVGMEVTAVMTMRRALARKVTESLYGGGPVSDEDVADAIEEILNVVMGNAKGFIEDKYGLARSVILSLPLMLPTNDIGAALDPGVNKCIVLTFALMDEQFEVLIASPAFDAGR